MGEIFPVIVLFVVVIAVAIAAAIFIVDTVGTVTGAAQPRRVNASRRNAQSCVNASRRNIVKNLDDWPPSKAEQYVRGEFEALVGCRFPTVYPSWLDGMELDGYCEKLALAFEYQGPQHTRFDKKYDRVYDTYYDRVLSDERKIELCRENGVDLVVVDYIVPRHLVRLYIESRLHDLYATHHREVLSKWRERPQNYMIEVLHLPYRNHVWEAEVDARRLREKRKKSRR